MATKAERIGAVCFVPGRGGPAGLGGAGCGGGRRAAAHLPAPPALPKSTAQGAAGCCPPRGRLETRRLLSGDAQELELLALIKSSVPELSPG